LYHDKVWGGDETDSFLQCLSCDVVFLHPFPEDEYVQDFYEKCFGTYMIERSTEMEWNDLETQYKKLSEREMPLRKPILNKYLLEGSVCDIGSSTGFTLDYLNKKGFQTFGVEPSKEHAVFAAKSGNKIFNTFNEIDSQFDNVIHYYVLEHVLDPINFLNDCLQILISKGRFIFEIPNRNDAMFFLYDNSPYKDFIMQKMHLFYFSDKSISHVLDKLPINYKIIKGQRYGLKNHLQWLINGKTGSLNLSTSKQTEKNYKDFLIKKGFNDYLIIIGIKK
tara:strand:- start:956 stop:1789 length:834 start_codon:yes stop_codon:yes gene_type:complete